MRFFLAYFKWIMLLSGVLTCSMFLAFFAPQTSLRSNFGTTIDSPVADIVVRNWGALIGLVGIMLIYGAFNYGVRKFVLVIAGISKIIFIALVLLRNESYAGLGAGTAVIADSVMVILYIIYLLASSREKRPVSPQVSS